MIITMIITMMFVIITLIIYFYLGKLHDQQSCSSWGMRNYYPMNCQVPIYIWVESGPLSDSVIEDSLFARLGFEPQAVGPRVKWKKRLFHDTSHTFHGWIFSSFLPNYVWYRNLTKQKYSKLSNNQSIT